MFSINFLDSQVMGPLMVTTALSGALYYHVYLRTSGHNRNCDGLYPTSKFRTSLDTLVSTLQLSYSRATLGWTD